MRETFEFAHIETTRRLIRETAELVKLCAFACEARRSLQDIASACDMSPDISVKLDQLIQFRNQWTTHNDNVELVLTQMANQLDKVYMRLEDGSSHESQERNSERPGI